MKVGARSNRDGERRKARGGAAMARRGRRLAAAVFGVGISWRKPYGRLSRACPVSLAAGASADGFSMSLKGGDVCYHRVLTLLSMVLFHLLYLLSIAQICLDAIMRHFGRLPPSSLRHRLLPSAKLLRQALFRISTAGAANNIAYRTRLLRQLSR